MDLPREIVKEAAKAENAFIPTKSCKHFEKEYLKFRKWMNEKHANILCEAVVLSFLSEQSTACKASTLWCTYSKLKVMLKIKDNIDTGTFHKVSLLMKQANMGYQPIKAMVFSQQDVNTFLTKADDETFLLMKVVDIFGIFGACRSVEWYNLCTNDVKEEGSVLIVNIKVTKNGKPRIFTIVSSEELY
ncbi:hypothetical protein R5R35_009177 [Gryllus longicercus]|uniref:Uncharacterized protein n=1 Tax=Gryllus longicercus TaxID=2509291 RepID=A0AAN9VG86_9ORTH